MRSFDDAIQAMPLIAILRHLQPGEAADIGAGIAKQGFTVIEVPLNDESTALRSIEILAEAVGDRAVIGAGTVTMPEQVQRVRDAGGKIIVSPDCNHAVIRAAVSAAMTSCPGVATPSEAFAALRSGANVLKLFPAGVYGPRGLRALRDVLPAETAVFPVGGVSVDNVGEWRAAGATGLGIGSSLFTPGMQLDEITAMARQFVAAWQAE